ncbi:hypothetical protein LPJ61_003858 [Coemansia biformis]|uniref:tRNA (cytosine(38)-C(5))-methyltransferase n=1 Tax=Coemansia biformis TaxID=1286918 RepID=A0A9W7Y5V3_9FUNG|nr:hypothetical protein LPJ61_003858 [Coemansia biformis]
MEEGAGKQPIVCLEFFSGIGGLHYGLLASGIDGRVAKSWDMNENANAVYYHNFNQRPSNKAIDYLTPKDIDRFGADCWSRTMLIEALFGLGFEVVECLLSPVQLGIPNGRLRYYLAARLRWPDPIRVSNVNSSSGTAADSAHAAWMVENSARAGVYLARGRSVVHTEWPFGPTAGAIASAAITRQPLSAYIDPASDHIPSLAVPEPDILKRRRLGFDIVTSTSECTSTFTKAYGSSHLIGSGSLLQTRKLDTDSRTLESPEELIGLGLRFFSPNEVARLHHFPLDKAGGHSLEFPSSITLRQRLQLLGNSLNVHVVAQLLEHVLFSSAEWS